MIQSEFHDNQRALLQALFDRSELRPGLDLERATDIVWALNHPDVWLLLTGGRGWTPSAYERWLADASCTQLLGTPTP